MQDIDISKLNYLSDEEVLDLRNKFKELVNDKIEPLTKDETDPARVNAIRRYAIATLLSGRTIYKNDLRYISSRSTELIKSITKNLADPLFKEYRREGHVSASKSRFINIGKGLFGTGKRRLYFPIDDSGDKSETEVKISKLLAQKNYKILDYGKGYATDETGKQEFKIGKIIKEDLDLLDAFKKDKTRLESQDSLNRGEYLLVLSDRATDIAYMSTRRKWTSCMAHNDVFPGKIPYDIEHGSLIAYLVKKDDPKIYKPLSRILLKPYYNEDGDVIYDVGKLQGSHDNGFINKVKEIAAVISPQKHFSLYQIPSSVYKDGSPSIKIELGEDYTMIELFDALNIDYIQYSDGKVFVTGDLDLSNLGLKKLPDLTKVEVNGFFSCGNNELTSLIGSPKSVGGSFFCNKNKLESLEGSPEEINGHFFCDDSELESLEGSPEIVHGDFFCTGNKLKSLESSLEVVFGSLNCASNKSLTSLKGVPDRFNNIISDLGNFPDKYSIPKHLLEVSKPVSNKKNNNKGLKL